MNASIQVTRDPSVQYLLRLGDTCLIHAQRLAEWCGHAPILEEDIAMTNIALDYIGQARALLTLAGQREGAGHDEDQLAYLREERDYVNLTLVELPRGDFAVAMIRAYLLASLLRHVWRALESSRDEALAAIAGKAIKEVRYHAQHAGEWVVRLGRGTPESARRAHDALNALWPYLREAFVADPVDDHAHATGFGPRWADLHDAWHTEVVQTLAAAGLEPPPTTRFESAGKFGRHSEHMGYILAELQHLQRAYPGGAW
ncbi:1,2-phenylacetyl-CoA epoxidase subunit PaaC [Pararobbsia silviterrae]|uniref:Phenylacetate-CoA oxygenase subunit PaaI n=1 Tax=Pararobbsia silviterrae TaxID=1792498 RepID=A0A494XZV8_9BURK|nr:1,2-phenylacetyl-CoA epoxidase subunit PaaC [Pararobbsia silviterrae]RKP56042.1 phenylacetate-CoA oxygenase subunit PaaI [Pararobbsia silviterrae]